MGISSKKSTTSQQSTSTTTPNVPQWGTDSLQGLNTQIENIANTDPSTFVTGPSALQTQGFTGAGDLGGWQSGLTNATDLANTTAGTAAPSILDNGGVAKYLDPYLKNVVDSSLADFDQSAGETRARQAAAGANADAFGGSRWGLQEGETEGQLARARSSLDSGLRSAGWTQASNLANEDANRASQGLDRNTTIAGLLANAANSNAVNARSDVASQLAAGDTQHDLAQDSATAPISLAQTVAALLGQNQLPLLTGQTVNSSGTSSTTSNPSTFGQIGQAITTAAKLAAMFG
jgi:hypothetical protein